MCGWDEVEEGKKGNLVMARHPGTPARPAGTCPIHQGGKVGVVRRGMPIHPW